MKDKSPINDLIRGQVAQQTEATRRFAQRLFGDKKSEEYMRGFIEGSEQATKLALKSIEKSFEAEGKKDE